MCDMLLLDLFFNRCFEFEINHGRFQALIAQTIFYVRQRIPGIQHVYCTAVSKAVNRIERLEALFRKRLFKIPAA